MLIESSLLVILGSVAGILLAYVIVRVLLFYLNRGVPAVQQFHVAPDASALLAVVTLTGIAVAAVLAPARKALEISPQQALRVD